MRPHVWWAVFALRVRSMLQYRTAAFAGLCTQFAWGFMYVMLYRAFYESGLRQSIDLPQLVSYVWLQQAFLMLTNSWTRDNEIADSVRSGQVAYELCRPQDLYFIWYARLLAQRTAGAALRCGPVLLLAPLLPAPFGLSLPASPSHFCLFLVTLLLAALLNTAIMAIMHTLVFKLMDIYRAALLVSTLTEFLSGSLVPVPFMPAWLQTLCYCLPFRYVVDLPYSGNIPLGEGLWSVGMQLIWIALLVFVGHAYMDRQLRHVVIQGG